MIKNLHIRFLVFCLFLLASAGLCEAPAKETAIPETFMLKVSRASVYQAVPWQTNHDNLTTASGFKLDSSYVHSKHRVLAISRDLLEYLSFGDKVLIEGAGLYDGVWFVHDLMNKRYISAIDFLTDIGTLNSLHSDVTLIRLDP